MGKYLQEKCKHKITILQLQNGLYKYLLKSLDWLWISSVSTEHNQLSENLILLFHLCFQYKKGEGYVADVFLWEYFRPDFFLILLLT